MMSWTVEQLERWIDCHMVDNGGHKIGTIADVYIDDATGEPEWLAVHTGLFGSHISFVPLAGATQDGDRVQVSFEKSVVKGSPNIPVHGELTRDEEERLYRHYGLSYGSATHPDPPQAIVDDADLIGSESERPASASTIDLQQSGSASITDVSPQLARTRLRRRDAAAVDAIDLKSDDIDSPV